MPDPGGSGSAAANGDDYEGRGGAPWLEGGENQRVVADHSNRDERMVKIRYACCASRIQHAYQNFRHRQYLRDWALTLVSERGRRGSCVGLGLDIFAN